MKFIIATYVVKYLHICSYKIHIYIVVYNMYVAIYIIFVAGS